MKWENCCRGRRSACPQVAVDGRKIWIRDDDGRQICVALSDFTDIHWKVKEILDRRIQHSSR